MSLESEIRKIITPKIINEDKDCDICSDGSPCICEKSQEVQEATLNEMDPTKHVMKNKDTGKFCVYDANNKKVAEFDTEDEANAYAKKNHDDLMKKEAINHADAHADAQQHSDGSMSVKKIPSMLKKPGDKHLHLHMKSYHKEKDGQAFAKKHGYKVSNYVKTGAGSRMNIHKESDDLMKKEDIRTLPKDKQRALQHADKTAKPKSKVSLAPTPGIKTEASLKVKDFTGKAPKIQGVTVKKGPSSPFGGHMVTMTGPEDKLIAYAKKHLDGKGNTLKDVQKSINEDVNLDEAFENFFAEGYEGEVKKVLDKKGIDAYFKNGKLMVSKRDKAMVMQILKRQDFDMPTIQVEEIRMKNNRFGLSDSLVDAVANVLAGKQPIEEKKHKKMDAVGKEDGDIDNDGDEDESDEYLAKKRKAIGKAMKKDGSGKEPVDTKPKMDEAKIDEKLTQRQKDMRDFGRGKDKHATANVKRRADDNKGPTFGDLKRRQHKGEPGMSGDDHDTSSRPKDKLATQPDAKSRLANKKSTDKFKARQSASQSGSGRNNMGGVGIREAKPKGKLPEDMTDAQMKRREEIVKELKKKSADFESRYGDKADAVMYATATKMAMKGK